MSSWRRYSKVTINDQNINKSNLQVSSEDSSFIVDVKNFLSDWYSEDESIAFRTSGSTGAPKLMCFSKSHCVASAKQTIQTFELRAGDRALLCLPMQYVAAKMMVIRALVGGLKLKAQTPSISPTIPASGVEFAAMTPMQVANMITTDSSSLDNIKTLIIGGGRVSMELQNQLVKQTNHIYETYGMTETLTHVAIRQIAPRCDDQFIALKNIRFSLGEASNLIIHVPYLSPSPVHTNDIVVLDGASRMTIKGRLDNIINSGGVKLQLEEIENKISSLLDYPIVCLGIEDAVLGEKLVLLVEAREDYPDLSKHLHTLLAENLVKVERPKKIYFVKRLLRTESGKINRKLNKSLILGH